MNVIAGVNGSFTTIGRKRLYKDIYSKNKKKELIAPQKFKK